LRSGPRASVMIEKFAGVRGMVRSEFLDLNHTSKSMILVSLVIPKFAPEPSLAHRRTAESGHEGPHRRKPPMSNYSWILILVALAAPAAAETAIPDLRGT